MQEFRLSDYAPIAIMFIVAGGFAVSQILATQLIGPRKRTNTKLMPYECGKDPVGSARERFSVKFYTVAVDFLLFDLEVLFLIPFAVSFKILMDSGFREFGVPAYIAVVTFLFMVVVGFVYAWRKGTFDWSVQARAEARAEAKAMFAERKRLRLTTPTKTGTRIEPVSAGTNPAIAAASNR
jgi:NADH-quinone oxidoreductase subunit A